MLEDVGGLETLQLAVHCFVGVRRDSGDDDEARDAIVRPGRGDNGVTVGVADKDGGGSASNMSEASSSRACAAAFSSWLKQAL